MSEQPRLLFCTFDVVPSPSGASRRITSFIQAASAHYQVVVLSTKTPDHSHIEKYAGARLLRVPVGSGDLSAQAQTFDRAVRRQVDSEEYALACFTDPFGGYGLCELRATSRMKLVYDATVFPSLELPSRYPELAADKRFLARVRRQELYCLVNADRVITGSELTRRYIEQIGVTPNHLSVLRSPAQTAAYPVEKRPAPTRSPMRILYLGSELSWQGVPTLIEAFSLVHTRAPMQLTIAGPPHQKLHPALEGLARQRGLETRIEWRGPVPAAQIPELMAAHDICVAPLDASDRNRHQGGPLGKVSEALAAGRPLIAADLPLTRELCPEGATVFFPSQDPLSLAERLVELARNPALREALGNAGRAYAEQHLDAELQNGKLLALFGELLGGLESEAELIDLPPMTATPTVKLLREGHTDPAVPLGATEAPARPPPLRPRLRPNLPETGAATPAITAEHLAPRPPPASASAPDNPQTPPASAEAPPPGSSAEPALPPIAGDALPTPVRAEDQVPPPEIASETPQGSVAAAPAPARTFANEAPRTSVGNDGHAPPRAHKAPQSALENETPPGSVTPAAVPARGESPHIFNAEDRELHRDAPPISSTVENPAARPPPSPPSVTAEKLAPPLPPEPPLPPPVPTESGALSDEEEEIISSEELIDVSAPLEPAEVQGKLDPWLAQLLWGYCPPDGAHFERHTPPTNFPGRDDPSDPVKR